MFSRISRRAWAKMERQIATLHELCVEYHEYAKLTVTVSNDIQIFTHTLLFRGRSIGFGTSYIAGGLKEYGAFLLNSSVDTVILLQDGSIAIRGDGVRHYVRIDRKTLDPKRFKDISSVINTWSAFIENPAVKRFV